MKGRFHPYLAGCTAALAAILLALHFVTPRPVAAEGVDTSSTTATDAPIPKTALDREQSVQSSKSGVYISVFGLGSSPMDEDLKVGGVGVSNPELRRSFGGGFKVGVFPSSAKGIFGLEGEVNGFGGDLRVPNTGFSNADANVVSLNWMANVLLRYPGSVFQPYIGAGGGLSIGFIDINSLQTGFVGVTGKSAESALAFQLFGGLRAYVSDRVYLFGEYKYFGTKYKWEAEGAGNPEVSLSFRAHIVAAGVGVSF